LHQQQDLVRKAKVTSRRWDFNLAGVTAISILLRHYRLEGER